MFEEPPGTVYFKGNSSYEHFSYNTNSNTCENWKSLFPYEKLVAWSKKKRRSKKFLLFDRNA